MHKSKHTHTHIHTQTRTHHTPLLCTWQFTKSTQNRSATLVQERHTFRSTRKSHPNAYSAANDCIKPLPAFGKTSNPHFLHYLSHQKASRQRITTTNFVNINQDLGVTFNSNTEQWSLGSLKSGKMFTQPDRIVNPTLFTDTFDT